MAVIVVLALLAILMIYLAANLKVLSGLNRELKLVERQQVRRLARTGALPTQTVNDAVKSSQPASQ